MTGGLPLLIVTSQSLATVMARSCSVESARCPVSKLVNHSKYETPRAGGESTQRLEMILTIRAELNNLKVVEDSKS